MTAYRIRPLSLLGVGSALALLVAFAVTSVTEVYAGGAPNDVQEDSYQLDTGDKLRIKVHEWPDLSGEYKVGIDRSISLPIIGQLSVKDLTPQQIATTIAERLKERGKLSDLPTATAEIIQYRPFFVVGYVMKPGEYEYRPRLTVLQAVSMAGGVFRFSDPGLQRLDRDSIQSRGELTSTLRKVIQLRAQLARLEAEVAGSDSIDFPADLVQQQDQSIKSILDTERQAFKSDKDAYNNETASAENMRVLLKKEVESLTKQADAEAKQLSTVNDEMAGVKQLAEKGLTTSPRTYLLERTKAQIVGQKQALETNIIRSQQSIEQVDQRLNTYRSQRMEKINSEMVKTHSDLGDAKERVQMLHGLIAEAEVSAPAQIAQRYEEDRVRYVIVRNGETASEVPASEATILMPSDVLKVQKVVAKGDEASASRTIVAP